MTPGRSPDEAPRIVGVISDTHGVLRPEAKAALSGSALILHAGDVGDPRILEDLERIAPVHAVHGNTDWGELRRRLPGWTVVDLGAEDGRVAERPKSREAAPMLAYMTHDLEDLDLDPAAAGFRLVVTGHTHRPLIQHRDGVCYLNPGSAGPRRFHLPVTVARVKVEDGGLRAEIVELDV